MGGFAYDVTNCAARELQIAELHEQEALQSNDVHALRQLWADNLVINGPSPLLINKKQFIGLMESGLSGFKLQDRHTVRVVVEDNAAIAIGNETILQTRGRGAGSVSVWSYTHFWIKRDERWQLAARHVNVMERGLMLPPAGSFPNPLEAEVK